MNLAVLLIVLVVPEALCSNSKSISSKKPSCLSPYKFRENLESKKNFRDALIELEAANPLTTNYKKVLSFNPQANIKTYYLNAREKRDKHEAARENCLRYVGCHIIKGENGNIRIYDPKQKHLEDFSDSSSSSSEDGEGEYRRFEWDYTQDEEESSSFDDNDEQKEVSDDLDHEQLDGELEHQNVLIDHSDEEKEAEEKARLAKCLEDLSTINIYLRRDEQNKRALIKS